MASMDINPPLQETYTKLSSKDITTLTGETYFTAVKECDLPLINLSHLKSPKSVTEREKCVRDIAQAASDWGFFQVINHGIPEEILKRLNYEEKKVFHQPFDVKARKNFLGLSPNSYRWGNPRANYVKQLSWSEAFHISMADLSEMNNDNLRIAMEKYANEAENTSRIIAESLTENLGYCGKSYFEENCVRSSCYIRMNRYPPCPLSSSDRDPIFGLIPHTDSDFLSVVNQDLVGGLQLFKDGAWIAVKPNPSALVINIGDLFQALSNGIYKSIKHRVIASKVERLSAAYFYCPTNDLVIESLTHEEPRIYRNFTFREFQRQNHKDVEETGDKIGIKRFIL